jgi:hypothetical protein
MRKELRTLETKSRVDTYTSFLFPARSHPKELQLCSEGGEHTDAYNENGRHDASAKIAFKRRDRDRSACRSAGRTATSRVSCSARSQSPYRGQIPLRSTEPGRPPPLEDSAPHADSS